MIRDAVVDDAHAICRIYNPYVENTVVTFETDPVTTDQMSARISHTTRTLPWLVLEQEGIVAGYAYAATWKERRSYRFTVETSIYLDDSVKGRGLGRMLYQALFSRLRALSVHAVVGAITLPNPASIALHERLGFERVAHFREVGWKFDRWIDVGYWEKILEPDESHLGTEVPLTTGVPWMILIWFESVRGRRTEGEPRLSWRRGVASETLFEVRRAMNIEI